MTPLLLFAVWLVAVLMLETDSLLLFAGILLFREGVGGKLMRAAVAIADRERLPCFLETCGPRNPDIYARYGFAVAGREEMRTTAGDACENPYIGMVRPAA